MRPDVPPEARLFRQAFSKAITDYRKVFRMFDEDGNGFIDSGEIMRVLDLHGIQLPEKQIADQIKKFDVNGKGCINFVEFVTLSRKWLEKAHSHILARRGSWFGGAFNKSKSTSGKMQMVCTESLVEPDLTIRDCAPDTVTIVNYLEALTTEQSGQGNYDTAVRALHAMMVSFLGKSAAAFDGVSLHIQEELFRYTQLWTVEPGEYVWGFGSSAKLCFVVLSGSLKIVEPFVQTTDLQTPQHSMLLVEAFQFANSLQTDIAHIIRELNEIESQKPLGQG